MSVPDDYELLDSGEGRKLERFGPHLLVRPAGQAIWRPSLEPSLWQRATATFDRSEGNRWSRRDALPAEWSVTIEGVRFKLSSTDFGHLGVFPEQRRMWRWIRAAMNASAEREPSLLNLFAYSGGTTLAAAQGGAHVCHLDASKGMVDWARENAERNGLAGASIRWIVDDAISFLKREVRRGRRYDAIVLDPPSFGRGRRGEVFKIDEHLPRLLDLCRDLLSDAPLFVLLTCHTAELSPVVLHNVVEQWFGRRGGAVTSGELLLEGAASVAPLPSGGFARWTSAEEPVP